jgi:hypothetical protein
MLRILGQISIFGTKASVERIASATPIPGGKITQIGLARRIPEPDSWCYESPRYRFHQDAIDSEVRDFVAAHARLGQALIEPDAGLKYAFFTLCPVEQSYEEEFACVLSKETLKALSDLGVALQVAPEPVMPDAPYWSDKVPATN